ncbi:pyrimidine 5'-nucleotidase [Kaistia dalseonensis]|uniref:Hydrolase of the HAD superfamily n=1 Tax=Kaistia dalseonensis TaxID=410840 RepID=A0ABU0H9H3_9HYPH|nr:pyrimidine 5'-nucleotidase [Kaistia dalseonensis]MCX5496349.1 pyrimidine 5'-nucleotidase [Kaistia dalseonensis]MDQ0438969.1 putative hydrolase of the HAD superfamily [Kaistia dalseonensis]
MTSDKPQTLDDEPDLSRFAPVRSWVFDLDNTLYPRHTNLFAQVDVRIRDYVQRLLSLEPDAAQALQRDYYRRYGTTLRGLILEHGISPDDFLEYVHDIDHSPVAPDPALAAAISALPGRRFIFTNGSLRHAEKVIERLGLGPDFDDIFDIVRADLVPKPHADTYARFLRENGIDPTSAAMFEDLARNLEVPKSLGMATVLIVPRGTEEVLAEAWETEGADGAHIDHLTDDLGGFLGQVLAQIRTS